MKLCHKCKLEKPEAEFPKNKTKKDGLGSQCSPCKKITQHIWYKKHAKEHYKRTRASLAKVVELLRKIVIDHLLNHPCAQCNESDILVLEFDHLSNKLCNISNMIGGNHSKEKLLQEIKKCQVLCSNCHKRKTHKEQNTFKYKHVANMGLKY